MTCLGKRGLWFAVLLSAALAGCGRSGQPTSSPEPLSSTESSTTAQASGVTPVATEKLVAYAPTPNVLPITTCNLERIDGAAFAGQPVPTARGAAHTLSGWIAAPGVRDPQYWLRFDDKAANHFLETRLQLDIKRPDVAASVPGAPVLSGFKLELPSDALPTGQYHVYLVAAAGGTDDVCDNGRQVNIGQ